MKKTPFSTLTLIFLCICIAFTAVGCGMSQKEVDGSLDNAIAPISEQVDGIKKSVSSLRATDTELGGYIDTLEAAVEKLEGELAAANAKIEALENDDSYATVEQLEGVRAGLIADIAGVNGAIDALKTAGTTQDSKITALETARSGFEGEISTIKTRLSAVEEVAESGKCLCDASVLATKAQLTEVKETLDEQLATVNAAIASLQSADGDITADIAALESGVGELEEKLTAIDATIAEVKEELEGAIETVENELLAALNTLKTDTEADIADLNTAIDALKAKDTALDGKITELEAAAATLADKDWANATFATLEQYSSIQTEISGIKASIADTNAAVAALETRLNGKIETDIKTAIDNLRGEVSADYIARIDAEAAEITSAYTSAVDTARADITSAYTTAIASAILKSEGDMRTWVNVTLAEGYYTVAQIDAKLAAIDAKITTYDDSGLKASIAEQKAALEQAKIDLTVAYEKAISDAIGNGGGVVDTDCASAIEAAKAELKASIDTINTELATVKLQVNQNSSDIADLLERIENLENKNLELQYKINCLAGDHEYGEDDVCIRCGAEKSGNNSGDNSGETTDPVCTAHKDENDNGECDACGVSVVIVLDLFALNDLHGKFEDGTGCVGVDELSTYLVNECYENEATVVLSSGDMWQGSAESNLTKGAIITEWMNAMDFVSMTLGNHEFDWGSEYIESNAELAEFPILAINVYDDATGERAEFCEASVVVDRAGVKIGIIGAIGDCKSSISASLVEGLDFKVGDELTALVMDESERLRGLGCELIVYSLHDGNSYTTSGTSYPTADSMSSYYDVALSDGYVDVVFEGHSHASYVHVDEGGVYHLQNGGYDNGISHVELKINFANDTFTVQLAEIVENDEYASLEDHAIVDELMKKYDDVVSVALREVGNNSAERDASYIKNLVASLYLTNGLEKWGNEYDIILGGGYISTRNPHVLPMGQLCYYDLMSVLPFDNEIFLCSIPGVTLKSQFINSTNANYFVAYSKHGVDMMEQIDDNGTYYIIADKYSVDYAPNNLTPIESLGEGIFARDLVASYATLGGLTDEITISEALELGAEIPHGYKLIAQHYIQGVIVEIVNTEYGNMYIQDEEGNRIYVYGLKDEQGNYYSAMTTPPAVGDTIRICTYVSNYNGPQLKDSYIVAIVL